MKVTEIYGVARSLTHRRQQYYPGGVLIGCTKDKAPPGSHWIEGGPFQDRGNGRVKEITSEEAELLLGCPQEVHGSLKYSLYSCETYNPTLTVSCAEEHLTELVLQCPTCTALKKLCNRGDSFTSGEAHRVENVQIKYNSERACPPPKPKDRDQIIGANLRTCASVLHDRLAEAAIPRLNCTFPKDARTIPVETLLYLAKRDKNDAPLIKKKVCSSVLYFGCAERSHISVQELATYLQSDAWAKKAIKAPVNILSAHDKIKEILTHMGYFTATKTKRKQGVKHV